MAILDKLFGDANARELNKYNSNLNAINDAEKSIEKLSDSDIRKRFLEISEAVQKKIESQAEKFDDKDSERKILMDILNQHLVEVFALIREAAKRSIGQRHYDVQLLGGMVLNSGKISEMKTGEGKTLVATLAVGLNALTGRGVHVVTVNDYLARRDAGWMGRVYNFLGLTCSTIVHDRAFLFDAEYKNPESIDEKTEHLREISRKEAYRADITYGTNNEFGFDYLRDNMAQSFDQMVQRPLHFAIVDEVDSILIDEARTPLIISAAAAEATDKYYDFARLVKGLKAEKDYVVDEKMRSATLTDDGISHMEKLLGVENIYEEFGMDNVHHIEQALKAEALFKKDRDYVIRDGEIIIVDEFTGRLMVGRRYSEVLRKEGKQPDFQFTPRDHIELTSESEEIDTERAAKVAGSRFGYLKGKIAILELALLNYAVDMLTKEGFTLVFPPVLISRESMEGMGYLEHGGEDETYYLPKDDMFLVGTSEHSIGAMHKGEMIEEHKLPLRYIAFSTCFRREAGSYGKDTKGIFRVHQFDKLEMFSYVTPDASDREHDFLLALEEKIVKGLGLPYQVVKMCTGDLGAPAARKYDIETWLPTQGKYRETHSTSTCTDFQARRLNIKYRKPDGTKEYVHTLNGTAVAFGRMLIMILENNQQKDGSIKIPEVLQKYTGFKVI